MPPKRSVEQLQELASNPTSWLQTTVAAKRDYGLTAPYFAAFLKHHIMPMSNKEMMNQHGVRLWNTVRMSLPEGAYDGNLLLPLGILPMLLHVNHGFKAPLQVQDGLLQFLGSLPAGIYGEVTQAIRGHYQICRNFRLTTVKEQPDYLDIFKDDRTEKRWRSCDHAVVLINGSSVIRTWPELMHSGWNSANANRDVQAIQEHCNRTIQELHEAIDKEGGLRIYAMPW